MKDEDKAREDLIAEERDRLQMILTAAVECLPFGFWALGAEGRYILDNAANRALWGEIVGKLPSEVVPDAKTLSIWLDNNRRVLQGERIEGDVDFAVKGETRSYHNVAAPIRKGEEILGILGVNVDITDRKRAEEALRESEERFQAFMTNAPSIAWMKDELGRHVYRNKSAETRFGWRREDWLGRTDFELWPKEIAEQFRKNDMAVLASGQTLEFIETNVGPNGEVSYWWNFKFPFRDASGKRYVGGVGVDVTARKRAEEALRETEQRFRTVLENSLDAAYRRNLATDDYDYMSPAIEHLTGFTGDEIARMSITDVLQRIHPEDLSRVSGAFAEASEGKTATGVLEYRFRGKDGVYRWLADRFRVLRDAEGRPLYLLGIVRDITERKRAEEVLRQARDELERRVQQRTADLSAANEQLRVFQMFADAAGQGFGMTDLEGRVTYVNAMLCQLLGERSPQDAVGKHVSAYLPEEYVRKREEEILPALSRNGYWYGDYVLLSRHGKATPILQNSFLIRDERGTPFRVATVFTDISDRKRAEEELRQSHDHLQAIYEGMIEGLLITDIETKRFVRVNSALCRMLGYSEAELLAASIKDIHPPEEVSNDLRRFQAVAEGRVLIHEDRPVLKKDGSIFYADIVGHRIVYGGRPCTLALIRDVTERKRAQESLERQRRTLERLFRSSDHERQLIAYEIHDGLAQYLAGAIMQFDAFAHLKDAAPKDSAKAFEAGMMILRQGHAEARRLISGVRPPILDEEGIVAAIAHLIHEQRAPGGPKIEFHSRVEFDRLVSIQESTIYRIVQEGLTNACKHGKSQRIRVELVQQGDAVRIVVQDWGVGFDPSRTGENCYGLEGIRERARLLGGQSSVESALGEGTRLTVELPLVVRDLDAGG